MSEKEKQIDSKTEDMEFTWPGLVFKELMCMAVVMIVLIAWSIMVDAPLKELANPGVTENPAKAPWYFLGLQELLVYFDPWMAGVVLPTVMVLGLIVIPYVDPNPVSGGYTFSRRKFAMINFGFGTIFWFVLIFIGTFLRGPSWQFYWPWESWAVEKHLEESLWSFHPLLGVLLIAAYFGIGMTIPWLRKKDFFRPLGVVRYSIVMGLILMMYAVPVKILLRLLFNVRYVLITPWFNI